jgi:hypothetical protein
VQRDRRRRRGRGHNQKRAEGTSTHWGAGESNARLGVSRRKAHLGDVLALRFDLASQERQLGSGGGASGCGCVRRARDVAAESLDSCYTPAKEGRKLRELHTLRCRTHLRLYLGVPCHCCPSLLREPFPIDVHGHKVPPAGGAKPKRGSHPHSPLTLCMRI